jgi:hypothetical protein
MLCYLIILRRLIHIHQNVAKMKHLQQYYKCYPSCIEEDETKTSDTVEHETNSSVTEEDEGGVNCSVTEKLKRKSNMQR